MLTSSQIYQGKKLEVLTLPVGQMQANCYLVVDKQRSSCLIIDPGDDAEYIENIIQDRNLKPTKIICTHGHFDHVGAVLTLKLAYQIPFMISKKDEFLLKKARSSASHFIGMDNGPAADTDGYLEEKNLFFEPPIGGEKFSLRSNNKSFVNSIKLGRHIFTILETPGHTPGSVCLYSNEENLIFVGDLVFAEGGVGRTDFSYSNSSELQKSLEKIFKLPKSTLIFPGHGESFNLP